MLIATAAAAGADSAGGAAVNDKTLAKIVELVPARVILALSDSFAFSRMHAAGPKNPLHGITLEKMLVQLVEHYGWEMLGRMIQINCFNFHPSIKSSLTFLRRTPWARAKVEALYLDSLPDMQAPVPPDAEAAGPAVEGGEK